MVVVVKTDPESYCDAAVLHKGIEFCGADRPLGPGKPYTPDAANELGGPGLNVNRNLSYLNRRTMKYINSS